MKHASTVMFSDGSVWAFNGRDAWGRNEWLMQASYPLAVGMKMMEPCHMNMNHALSAAEHRAIADVLDAAEPTP